ncbi:MAG: helix-turn-helix domain-containing protein [Bacteroidota bacterium]
MNIYDQLIFLLSALGGINGLLLSGYFFLEAKKEKRVSYNFLGGLILMLSIRTIKSVFLYFNHHLFEFFIEAGLAACFLIGPFLYLYTKSMIKPSKNLKRNWWWHIIPYILTITIFATFYSYYHDRALWQSFGRIIIYKQWMIYILLSGILLFPVFKKIGEKEKLKDHEFWLINVFIGTFIVWLAYETTAYTSYIVGALSFSFLIYTSILLWIFKRFKKQIAVDEPKKYANSPLTGQQIIEYKKKLEQYIVNEKPYLDPNLKLDILSKQIGISSKELSQVINQSFGQNYSQYIAALRIEEAKKLLSSEEYYHNKIAAIAYESGFNSLSSFNTYFRKLVGMTAKEYRESLPNY